MIRKTNEEITHLESNLLGRKKQGNCKTTQTCCNEGEIQKFITLYEKDLDKFPKRDRNFEPHQVI